MIYVDLKGRMCNQMFQIAAAKALALQNNDSFRCSNNVSGIKPSPEQTKRYRMTIFEKVQFGDFKINEKNTDRGTNDFSYKEINYKKDLCLAGYYQSEKFFIHREKEIREMFRCSPKILKFIEKNYHQILQKNNTCAVHIRRGDYVKYKEFHNNLGPSYYRASFEQMKGKYFVFFSDDILWCKNNFKDLNATFVDSKSDIIDFYLMSMLRNQIIANSSFSWWAAWLNTNKNKTVFAPKKWFGIKNKNLVTKDLIPSNWEIIDA